MQQVWTSDREGSLGGVPVRYISSDFDAHKTTEDQIVLLKPASMMMEYQRLASDPRRIVEVGIYQGGSALLMADMFPSSKVLGIDWARQGNPAILHHVQRLGFSGRLRLYFGISQDDPYVTQLVENEFGREPLDLVVDDASHNYGYTTRCFDMLFPTLAVGGVYIIEDWGWRYWPGFTPAASLTEGGPPLSDMILQLVAAAAIYGTIQVEKITGSLCAIRKLGDLPPFEEIRAATDR